MKKSLLLIVAIALGGLLQAQTYNQNAGSWSGTVLSNWVPFTFTNTPATNGTVELTFSWMACYQSAFGSGSKVWIEFQTSSANYTEVYYEGNNTSSCVTLSRTVTVTNQVFNSARNFSGNNSVIGRVRIYDACYPGVGCSFSTDPKLSNLRMQYNVRPANFSATGTSLCPGGTVQFSDGSLVNPTAYAWTFPGGVPATSSAQNPVVQYPASGNYDVKLLIQTANGPDSLVRTNYVNVHPLPAANAGLDRSFCAGSSVQLSAQGGTGYQWFPADGLSDPGIANPVATPMATATYTVMVTSAQGCQNSDAITLTMVPLPQLVVAGADEFLCAGDTALLTATGAELYTWSPNLFINTSSGDSVRAWPASTFTWNLHGTDLVGCNGDTSVTITVSPLPAVPVITVGANGLSTTAATSYQWFLEGAPIAGATGQAHQPEQNGNYMVRVTNAGGCSATSAVFYYGSIGLAANNGVPFAVHPQPAHDRLVVQGIHAGQDLRLLDATGRTVLQATSAAEHITLSVGALPAGSYVLRVSGNGQRYAQRIAIGPR